MDPNLIVKNENSVDYAASSAADAANDQKRRSSSRSIKRKRFDDEIVEYSLGIPPAQLNRFGRARTQSQTYVNTFPETSQPSASGMSPSLLPPTIVPVVAGGIAPPSLTVPQSIITTVAATLPQQTAPLAASMFMSSSPIHALAPPTMLPAPHQPPPTPVQHGHQLVTAVLQPPLSSPPPPPPPSSTPLPPATINPTTTHNEKRRVAKGSGPAGSGGGSSKKAKKNRGSHQTSTKDLGRWKPIDDLALIIGIQQTNDLRMVHRGTKFSCKFTVQEMQSRWYSLLYEESISRIAVAAMRNLHPELVESVQSKALYTTQEEEVLGTIKSSESPNNETFQDLLDKHAQIFYPARTAKALSAHWQLMKQYHLLPDQSVHKSDNPISFSEAEELLNDADLQESKDDALDIELALADRTSKKEIRQLENELTRWTVLVDSLTGIGFTPEFDVQTLAVLRGRLVRYLMRSREITFGRTTKDQTVDVDLTLEGPAHKVSRKQGTIKLRSNGDFFVSNEGKRPLYIDGMPLLQGNKTRLHNNCVVEMAGLRFIFLVNGVLINAIRQESAKMNGPLN